MSSGVDVGWGGRSVRRLATAGLMTLSLASALHADLKVNSWRLTSETAAIDFEGLPQMDAVTQHAGGDNPPPALPFILSDTAVAVQGVSESHSAYNFSTSGDAGVFSFGFKHLSSAFVGDLASGNGTIVFTPSVDSTFTLSGGYEQTGLGTSLLDVSLGELGSAPFFENRQTSEAVSGGALTLGATDGTTANTSVGSVTGSLQAGVSYRLLYNYQISGAGGSPGFSATGNLLLNVTPQSVTVPAPAALALALVGFTLIGLRRRGNG